MVCENDILEIEKLYETMKNQNKGEVREKIPSIC